MVLFSGLFMVSRNLARNQYRLLILELEPHTHLFLKFHHLTFQRPWTWLGPLTSPVSMRPESRFLSLICSP